MPLHKILIMMTKSEKKLTQLFNRGCTDFHLLEDGDRILIALSGGKDSLALLRLLGQRAKIFRPSITVEAVHVIMDNIPYETERTFLETFCQQYDVKLNILHTRFEESTDKRKTKCFLCSWHRRKAIFEYATEHHFNKVALGHHQDDILVTALMNLTFEGSFSTMKPSLQLEHYPITIIRPLCLVPESLIRELASELSFQKQKTPCPYEQETRRTTMTQYLSQLESINKEARHSLWHAIQIMYA